MSLFLEFVFFCSLVIYGGIELTRKGDQLEEIVGVSAGFVGTVLLAMTTSLPEFVATFSSIYKLNAPQLALGNIFGSNTFNLAILAVMDLFFMREVLYSKVHPFIIRPLAVGQILTGLALAGIYLNSGSYTLVIQGAKSPLMTVNLFTAMILVVYVLSFKSTTETSENLDPEEEKSVEYSKKEKTKLIMSFSFFALMVVVSGVYLTEVCDEISVVTGLGKTFIGSILLAFATSLPEATVCVTAVRLGAFDLVFGNVLGSNIFNIFILGLAEVFTPSFSMTQVEYVQLNFITGFGSFIMSSVVLFAIFYRGKNILSKSLSLILILTYLITYYIMYVQQKIL